MKTHARPHPNTNQDLHAHPNTEQHPHSARMRKRRTPRENMLRMMATITCVVALAFGLNFVWKLTHQPKKPTNELKFYMPGKYKCTLKPGTYHGWVFNKWKSKNVNEPELLFDNVTIKNSRGIEVGEDISKTLANEVANQIILEGKEGHLDFLLEIPELGKYTVEGAENSVIVIAPNSEVHSDATHLMFEGLNDDLNFIPQ